jgi:hypothetical protein
MGSFHSESYANSDEVREPITADLETRTVEGMSVPESFEMGDFTRYRLTASPSPTRTSLGGKSVRLRCKPKVF